MCGLWLLQEISVGLGSTRLMFCLGKARSKDRVQFLPDPLRALRTLLGACELSPAPQQVRVPLERLGHERMGWPKRLLAKSKDSLVSVTRPVQAPGFRAKLGEPVERHQRICMLRAETRLENV